MGSQAKTSDLLDYSDYVAALHTDYPQLASEIADFRGIEKVLQWMERSGLAQAPIELIAQDEFESDFLLELEPGGRWLAFGVT
jgi:hypothetical protein